MAYHNEMYFTTKDNDNDNRGDYNCAISFGPYGGWWYNGCWRIVPNNIYNHRHGIVPQQPAARSSLYRDKNLGPTSVIFDMTHNVVS